VGRLLKCHLRAVLVRNFKQGLLAVASAGLFLQSAGAATLSGSWAAVPEGSVVDLTAEGKVDWVHWGLYTDSSLNRKSDVAPRISDLIPVYDFFDTNASTSIFRYEDNLNGYSWSDGFPAVAATNTPTGVWAYGWPPPGRGSGFEISVPADTPEKILSVYVGSFAAEGLFETFLSDGSAPAYTNRWGGNLGNGPGRVYSIRYSANSAGQRLVVRWTLVNPRGIGGGAANVTLQAATLTHAEANNPPVVTLTAPTNNAQFATGANIELQAEAQDADGSVTLVEFWNADVKIGEDSTDPYSVPWNNLPAGRHILSARAIDASGAVRRSIPVEIFVHGSGATLTGSMDFPPSLTDLTAEGTIDWIHLGLRSPPSLDRKANVVPQIKDFTLNGNTAVHYSSSPDDNPPYYSWSDGTPTLVQSPTATGVYVSGYTNGFAFSVPADRTPRRLKVYASMYGVEGNFQAYLSDASAPAYTDTSFNSIYGSAKAVFVLNYTAGSANQQLHVRYRCRAVYDMDYGNVAIESITLQGPAGPLLPRLLTPAWTDGDFTFSVTTEAGRTYEVEYTDSLLPQSWQVLTNFAGTGSPAAITDPAPAGQRFYRARSQ
jgi:hypothetical protein